MLKVNPIFEIKPDPTFETDVLEVIYTPSNLKVVVEVSNTESYQIFFNEQIWAFRYMEEGDLTHYWESELFNDMYIVYEINSGGWLSKEGSNLNLMGIANSPDGWLKEWFIPTKNFSVTVLSNSLPKITRLTNA